MNKLERFLKNVWPRIENFLNLYSQANYKDWYGPYIWNEDGDLKRIVTRFCEEEFGFLIVHNEIAIAKYSFENFNEHLQKGIWIKRARLRIDIDITDARDWKNLNDLSDRDLLTVTISGKGQVGRTKLISVSDIESQALENEVIKSIKEKKALLIKLRQK